MSRRGVTVTPGTTRWDRDGTLSATRGTIVTTVVRECATLPRLALVLSVSMALALSRLPASQLFHVSAANALPYATAAALLVAVAARIHPKGALRSE